MISDDEIQEIIADAENKIGDYHALIMSKKAMISICKELLVRRRDESIQNASSK